MRRNINWRSIVIVMIFFVATLLFILKALITTEISLRDEGNYIATAFRFYKGDAVMVDDWSPWQLSSVLLLPYIHIYMAVVGTTEGIILFFRILYIIFKLVLSVLAICKLNNFGAYGKYGWLGVGFFYCFTPFNIDSLSYNTISLAMIFIVGIFILTESKKKSDYFLCGIFLAVSVLASPFLILIYVAGFVTCVMCQLFNKKQVYLPIFDIKNFSLLTAGAGVVAIAFIFFVFSRAGIGEIISNVFYIINEPDHNLTEGNFIVILFFKLFKVVKIFFREYIVVTIINGLYVIFCIMMRLKKKENYLLPGAVLCLFLSCIWIIVRQSTFMENAFYIPFVWFALEEIIICKKIKEKEIIVFVMALIYSAGIALGTNTEMFATSATFCAIAVFSIICVGDIERQKITGNSKVVHRGIGACISVLLACTFIMRLVIAWGDVIRRDEYINYINRGPLRGTYAQKAVYDSYEGMIDILDTVSYDSTDILFCGTTTPLSYIYTNVECGMMCTQFFYLDYSRVDEYFEMHPEKYPTIVYYERFSEKDKKSKFYRNLEEQYEIKIFGASMIAHKK